MLNYNQILTKVNFIDGILTVWNHQTKQWDPNFGYDVECNEVKTQQALDIDPNAVLIHVGLMPAVYRVLNQLISVECFTVMGRVYVYSKTYVEAIRDIHKLLIIINV